MEKKTLKMETIRKCNHLIFDPDHYREDETCRCDDPDHDMSDWGYEWNGTRWISPLALARFPRLPRN